MKRFPFLTALVLLSLTLSCKREQPAPVNTPAIDITNNKLSPDPNESGTVRAYVGTEVTAVGFNLDKVGEVRFDETVAEIVSKEIKKLVFKVPALPLAQKDEPQKTLLQVFDEGQLTDGIGRKVDFKNTILIMTSNIGSRELKDFGTGMGFSTSATEANKGKLVNSVLENALKKTFAPEFLNRIDDIVYFNNIEKPDVIRIIDIELAKLISRVELMGLKVTVTDKAKEFLAETGWDANFGARPLKRAIQKNVEDLLAEEILKQTFAENASVTVDYDDVREEMVVR